ncbi:MAG: transposase [Eubacterium sp.]|nr:transposase [Eubacterium sp.]
MQKNELLRKEDNIVRILAEDRDEVLYIQCRGTKASMSGWCKASDFKDYKPCTEDELLELYGMGIVPEDNLSAKERDAARERYAVIVPVLLCMEDESTISRTQMIERTAKEHGVTKQTVRNYLKMYLTYNSISALVRKHRTTKEKPVTEDEKNIRWAVNKYVYSRKKNSLHTAYKLMLKEKYTDSEGVLAQEYPSFNQFRYWYAKNKNHMSYYIAREGKTGFMRNHRVLVGDNVQAFAAAPGVGMADSTIIDLYVVLDDKNRVIGRPVLAAMVDAYSYLCLGYSLGWEGGEYSLQSLMTNVVADKKEHCHKFGIGIEEEEWPSALPGCIVTDQGKDYAGNSYAQMSELGVKIINLEAYRPDEKGVVEKFFDIIQGFFKPYLKEAGVVAKEYLKRGSYFGDYKEKSCLTLKEFETILLRCIIHYNSKHILKNFPFTEEMLGMEIKPYSNSIWQYGLKNLRVCNVLKDITKEQIVLTLLPRTTGSFSRFGLKANGLRYFAEGFFERCLKGGKVTVAYDRTDVSCVWMYEAGEYTRFDLIESRYQGKDLEAVLAMKKRQNEIMEQERQQSIQSEINLASHIEAIKQNAMTETSPDVKNIRETREEERKRKHINHIKEAGLQND